MKKILFLIFIIIPLVAIANTVKWTVDNTVYQTTTCTAGDTITPPSAPIKTGYTFNQWRPVYTTLEYIESTGDQYINLGVKNLLGTDPFVISTTVATTNNSSYGAIFGNRHNPAAGPGFALYLNTLGQSIGSDIILFSRDIEDYVYVSSVNFYDGNFHAIDAVYNGNGTGAYVIDGMNFLIGGFDPDYNVDNDLYYYIFSNGEGLIFIGKMKTLTVTVNGILRYKFIPVRRNTDNAVGMYDTVSGTFFGNAGSGSFVAGPAI